MDAIWYYMWTIVNKHGIQIQSVHYDCYCDVYVGGSLKFPGKPARMATFQSRRLVDGAKPTLADGSVG